MYFLAAPDPTFTGRNSPETPQECIFWSPGPIFVPNENSQEIPHLLLLCAPGTRKKRTFGQFPYRMFSASVRTKSLLDSIKGFVRTFALLNSNQPPEPRF